MTANASALASLVGLTKETQAIIVWDPERRVTISQKTMHMRVDYNPYEGRQVVGGPSQVLSRGRLVIDNDKFVGQRGHGQFLKRGQTLA